MKLTKEQLTAIDHDNGHARIIAVAGAGKTATLTHYLAKRVEAGSNPKRILVLMYNKAVKDAFEQRLQQFHFLQIPTIRTFHSLGLKLYQGLIEQGFLAPCSLTPLKNHVLDLQIKQLLQANSKSSSQMQSNEALKEWIETTKNFIQLVKCSLEGPERTFDRLALDDERKWLIDIFVAFEQWRKDSRAITYDDMLFEPAQTFFSQPESQVLFKNIMDEILVDEYQDINPIQHFLLKVISGERAKVIVIGDPDQTIYEFRGSSPKFISHTFSKDFLSPKNYSLSQTFRFGHQLALAANFLISNNKERDPILTVSSSSTPETKIHLAETRDHGSKIAATIEALHQNGAAYAGMAVLCRLWSFARPVELALMAKGIPYLMEGEDSIFHCWELRPFIHILKLLSGDFFDESSKQKEDALFDILSIPSPKIPHKILRNVASQWLDIINENNINSSLQKAIPKGLAPYQTKVLKEIAQALKSINLKKYCVNEISKYAHKLDYYEKLKSTALSPTKGIEHAGTASAFVAFLQTLKGNTANDVLATLTDMQGSPSDNNSNAVTITTIHRSKGREWPAVFIPDLTEGHIPYMGNAGEYSDFDTLESERRLMYVAMTRTKKHLFLTTSEKSSAKNSSKSENTQAEPSRFINEMELDVCRQVSQAICSNENSIRCKHHNSKITEQYLSKIKHPISVSLHAPEKISTSVTLQEDPSWAAGDRVQHAVLGLGEIIKLENDKIVICFDKGGFRTFVSELAKPHLSLATST